MPKTTKLLILIAIWLLLFFLLWAKNHYAVAHHFDKWWLYAIDIVLSALLFKWSIKFYKNK